MRLLAAFGLLAVPLLGQEVKIVGPRWSGSGPAPADLPPLRGFNIEYPSGAENGGEIGYVLVRETVAANGKEISRQIMGNGAVFEHAVDQVENWRIGPAMREGKPVDSDYSILVIFNSAAATAGASDGPPRLLSGTTGAIYLNAERFMPEPPPQAVETVLHITDKGRVVDVDLPPGFADLKEDFMHSLRGWRFTPARQRGQPVAANLPLALVVQPRPPPGMSRTEASLRPAHPPVPIRQVAPKCPPELRRTRLSGVVVVSFSLDTKGNVQNAAIVRSDEPRFDDAALTAVRQWKFKPATLADGTPVPISRMQVPIVFNLGMGL